MLEPEIPYYNEQERLKNLKEYQVPDSYEEGYDEITHLAAQISGMPMAFIALVDENNVWIKSSLGFNYREIPRGKSFCKHTINNIHEALIVPDARKDERFTANSLVTGSSNIIFYAGIPLVSQEGFALGTLCVLDSQPNQLKDEQIQSLKKLANQVVRLLKSNAISAENEALKNTNQELDNFVYRVSHDLKSPIASSLGLAQIIQKSSDIEEIYKCATLQINSLKRLDHFISDILNYSRNSWLEVDPVPINFQNIIENILEENQYIEENKGVDVIKDITGDQNFISDHLRINIILRNLISNAFKYQKDDIKNPRIKIDIKVKNNQANIIIDDNGIGIPEENKDRIYDMFFRGTTSKSGSGIGLYIVKECIERIKGAINFETKPGQGTRFYIQLPALEKNK